MKPDSRESRAPAAMLAIAATILPVLVLGGPTSRAANAQGSPRPQVYLPLLLKNQPRNFQAPVTEPTDTPRPSPTAIVLPTLTPTRSVPPTVTPTPTATATVKPSGPEWLAYVNHHRGLARLTAVTENTDWSRGGQLHSRYMAENKVAGHSESPGNRFYTKEGLEAARNGNVFLAGATHVEFNYKDAIDSWMTGPFHMLGIIDPRLAVSGFGEYVKEHDRMRYYAATLDVLRGRGEVPDYVRFPVYYPADRGVLPNLTYDGNESPNPLLACPGYTEPTGAPIALQLGGGEQTPKVKKTSFKRGDTELAHCWFDETKYRWSPGQGGLDMRDAVIVMPRAPLEAGQEYTASIEVDGATYSWSFSTARTATALAREGVAPMPALDPR